MGLFSTLYLVCDNTPMFRGVLPALQVKFKWLFSKNTWIWPKIFSKKIPRFFFFLVCHHEGFAHRKKKTKIPLSAPNGMSPLRPAIPSAPRNFSGFQWNRSSRARIPPGKPKWFVLGSSGWLGIPPGGSPGIVREFPPAAKGRKKSIQ